jgi:hypothetical protein
MDRARCFRISRSGPRLFFAQRRAPDELRHLLLGGASEDRKLLVADPDAENVVAMRVHLRLLVGRRC